MFKLDRFVADCVAALAERESQKAVREVVARAVSDPAAVLAELGEPRRAEVRRLHQAGDLTILNLVWGPEMTLMPHDHRMWSVIGIYTGREDNIFWRRVPEAADGRIEAAGAKALGPREVWPLGRDVIHSVTNPIPRLTGAIHVYGGDFFATPRSEWDPESLSERAYDVDKLLRLFERSNASLPAANQTE
jgi:predicted metal-dependent enzyme (double-stranded beta helix superfamily)